MDTGKALLLLLVPEPPGSCLGSLLGSFLLALSYADHKFFFIILFLFFTASKKPN